MKFQPKTAHDKDATWLDLVIIVLCVVGAISYLSPVPLLSMLKQTVAAIPVWFMLFLRITTDVVY